MTRPTLSILICSLEKRKPMLDELVKHIHWQMAESSAYGEVEIVTQIDNGEITTGAKRNSLLSRANGIMVVFADDDDKLSDDYVKDILDAAKMNPDVIGFCGHMTTNGGTPTHWKISKDLPYDAHTENGQTYYRRFNNHLSPIKREIALQIGFKEIFFGEDYDYALRLKESGLIKSEVFINKELYFYNFITQK
jgi:glycosyltransferase involved in cell wall biosynthesis